MVYLKITNEPTETIYDQVTLMSKLFWGSVRYEENEGSEKLKRIDIKSTVAKYFSSYYGIEDGNKRMEEFLLSGKTHPFFSDDCKVSYIKVNDDDKIINEFKDFLSKVAPTVTITKDYEAKPRRIDELKCLFANVINNGTDLQTALLDSDLTWEESEELVLLQRRMGAEESHRFDLDNYGGVVSIEFLSSIYMR